MGNDDCYCCTSRADKGEGDAENSASGDVEATSVFAEKEPAMPTREAECILRCKNELGESVLWCPRQQRLYWLDLSKQELWSLEPKEAVPARQAVDMGWQGGCLALRQNGGFVVCSALGIGLLDKSEVQNDGPRLSPRIVCHPIESEGLDSDVVRLNNGRVDPQGRLVVGAYHSKYKDFTDGLGGVADATARQDPRGGVYRVSVTSSYLWGPTGHLEVLSGLGKVSVANGTAFFREEDGQHVMYLVDSPTRRVRSFRYSDTLSGETSVTEPLFHQGNPDGACLDSEGGYWITEFGGGRVLRIKDGIVSMVVQVAAPMVTCCAFGGPDLDVLYITTALRKDPKPSDRSGGLFACHGTGYRGMPENYFDG